MTLGPWLKGYPPDAPPCEPRDIAARGWNVLAGDLPLPLAVLDAQALAHNIDWMQAYARAQGIDLAPHGKTTMSPELFARQLAAGAWGITFANVFQLRVGVAAGVRRTLIANQLVQAVELSALQSLRARHADLRVVFLVDSPAQLQRIEAWAAANADAPPFEVLLEIGVPGGRTGVRGHDEALALARALEDARLAPTAMFALGGRHEAWMRAQDHQLQQPLVVSVMDRVGSPGVRVDVEGSGYGFRTLRRFAAAELTLPSTCSMTRPPL